MIDEDLSDSQMLLDSFLSSGPRSTVVILLLAQMRLDLFVPKSVPNGSKHLLTERFYLDFTQHPDSH